MNRNSFTIPGLPIWRNEFLFYSFIEHEKNVQQMKMVKGVKPRIYQYQVANPL